MILVQFWFCQFWVDLSGNKERCKQDKGKKGKSFTNLKSVIEQYWPAMTFDEK